MIKRLRLWWKRHSLNVFMEKVFKEKNYENHYVRSAGSRKRYSGKKNRSKISDFPIFPQEIFSVPILKTERNWEIRQKNIWRRDCWFPMS